MHQTGDCGLLSHVVTSRRCSGSVQRQCIPHEANHPTRVFSRLLAASCGIHCLTLAIMRGIFVILMFLVCGCASTHKSVSSHQTLLDEVLTKSEYADAIRQAERDLPDDRWESSKEHYNVSRSMRESAVASKILADIKPTVREMSVSQLMQSLKVVSYPMGIMTNDFPGVRGDVYTCGNFMITREIKSRPKSELAVLPSFADERVAIWTGPNGPLTTLAAFVEYDIYDK